MIRVLIVFFLFIIYGNINLVVNDLVILSLINIAFYTTLKQKKIGNNDIFILILSFFIIETFVGLPIFMLIVILFIPLILINYFINNLNLSLIIKSFIIFLLSFINLLLIDQTIIFRLLTFQYLTIIFIFTAIYLGLLKYGKE